MTEQSGSTRNLMLTALTVIVGAAAILLVVRWSAPTAQSVLGPGMALEEAVEQASAEGKPIYMEFYADWCVYCTEFEREVLIDPEVRQVLQQVVVARIDLDANAELAENFGIPGPPSGVLAAVHDGHLHPVARHVGAMDKEDFVEFIGRGMERVGRAAHGPTTQSTTTQEHRSHE